MADGGTASPGMHLREVRVDNFRSFDRLTSIPLFTKGPLGICGENGTGKTAIFMALRWALGECDPPNLLNYNNSRDGTVELVYQDDNGQTVLFSGVLRRNGTREFQLDGQEVPQTDVPELVRTRGMSVYHLSCRDIEDDFPAWITRTVQAYLASHTEDALYSQTFTEYENLGTYITDTKKEIEDLKEIRNRNWPAMTDKVNGAAARARLEEIQGNSHSGSVEKLEKLRREVKRIEDQIHESETKQQIIDRLVAEKKQIGQKMTDLQAELDQEKEASMEMDILNQGTVLSQISDLIDTDHANARPRIIEKQSAATITSLIASWQNLDILSEKFDYCSQIKFWNPTVSLPTPMYNFSGISDLIDKEQDLNTVIERCDTIMTTQVPLLINYLTGQIECLQAEKVYVQDLLTCRSDQENSKRQFSEIRHTLKRNVTGVLCLEDIVDAPEDRLELLEQFTGMAIFCQTFADMQACLNYLGTHEVSFFVLDQLVGARLSNPYRRNDVTRVTDAFLPKRGCEEAFNKIFSRCYICSSDTIKELEAIETTHLICSDPPSSILECRKQLVYVNEATLATTQQLNLLANRVRELQEVQVNSVFWSSYSADERQQLFTKFRLSWTTQKRNKQLLAQLQQDWNNIVRNIKSSRKPLSRLKCTELEYKKEKILHFIKDSEKQLSLSRNRIPQTVADMSYRITLLKDNLQRAIDKRDHYLSIMGRIRAPRWSRYTHRLESLNNAISKYWEIDFSLKFDPNRTPWDSDLQCCQNGTRRTHWHKHEKVMAALMILTGIIICSERKHALLLDEIDAHLSIDRIHHVHRAFRKIRKHVQVLAISHNREFLRGLDGLVGLTNNWTSKVCKLRLSSPCQQDTTDDVRHHDSSLSQDLTIPRVTREGPVTVSRRPTERILPDSIMDTDSSIGVSDPVLPSPDHPNHMSQMLCATSSPPDRCENSSVDLEPSPSLSGPKTTSFTGEVSDRRVRKTVSADLSAQGNHLHSSPLTENQHDEGTTVSTFSQNMTSHPTRLLEMMHQDGPEDTIQGRSAETLGATELQQHDNTDSRTLIDPNSSFLQPESRDRTVGEHTESPSVDRTIHDKGSQKQLPYSMPASHYHNSGQPADPRHLSHSTIPESRPVENRPVDPRLGYLNTQADTSLASINRRRHQVALYRKALEIFSADLSDLRPLTRRPDRSGLASTPTLLPPRMYLSDEVEVYVPGRQRIQQPPVGKLTNIPVLLPPPEKEIELPPGVVYDASDMSVNVESRTLGYTSPGLSPTESLDSPHIPFASSSPVC